MNFPPADAMTRNIGKPFSGVNPQSPQEMRPGRAFDFGAAAFLLDIDGTLLDFAATPAGVLVSASLQASLTKLWMKTGGATALVSGRLLEDIDRIFAPLELPAIGGHGAEIRSQIKQKALPRHPPLLDERIRRDLMALAEKGVLIEDKGYSMALHYRLAPQLKDRLERAVTAMLANFNPGTYEILRGKCVIEIKPRAYNKGSAVLELMENAPFRGRNAVFIGDDITDQAVFEILPKIGGTGFSVGALMQGATGVFAEPQDVRRWLASIVDGA